MANLKYLSPHWTFTLKNIEKLPTKLFYDEYVLTTENL